MKSAKFVSVRILLRPLCIMSILFATWIFPTRFVYTQSFQPHVDSGWHFRVLNRKYVSHILFETKEDRYMVTLIQTHGPAYWAFKSTSYPLHYYCPNAASCLGTLKELDSQLQRGWNIGLRIKGSTISEIIYSQPVGE